MIEIKSYEEFEEETSRGKVLIDIYSDYCVPCKRLKSEVLPKFDDKIKILTINGHEIPEISQEFNVYSVPALFLFENGQMIKQHTGFMDVEKMEEFIG